MEIDNNHTDPTNPIWERIRKLNRKLVVIDNSKKIATDDSFFSAEQSYVNDLRIINLIAEREQILTLMN